MSSAHVFLSVSLSLSLCVCVSVYMCVYVCVCVQFFVLGLQSGTELRVSLTRLDKFLSTQEPPVPTHTQLEWTQRGTTHTTDKTRPSTDKGRKSVDKSSIELHRHGSNDKAARLSTSGVGTGGSGGNGTLAAQLGAAAGRRVERGVVELRGADYDWARPLGYDPAPTDGAAATAAAAMAAGATSTTSTSKPGSPRKKDTKGVDTKSDKADTKGVKDTVGHEELFIGRGLDPVTEKRLMGPTLKHVRLVLRPGELLGVCGEVGAGRCDTHTHTHSFLPCTHATNAQVAHTTSASLVFVLCANFTVCVCVCVCVCVQASRLS